MRTLIGLEIHTELATKTKMFCACRNVSMAERDDQSIQPNLFVCPVCLGLPGALPVVNAAAVGMAVRAGLAFGCEIADKSKFDRKNYFYPDLPKGYQISQYDEPVCLGGSLAIDGPEGKKTIRLRRIHLEEDAAKNRHPVGTDYSLIDFNRAGTPLIESVTEPDLSSPEEARLFAQAFRTVLRYLKVSKADMEKGQMRVDANINVVAEDGRKTPITEIKNLNSFRSIERALQFEVKRHTRALEQGQEAGLHRETRGWLDDKGETVSQRSKEEAQDYRYFPEPDIPHLEMSPEFVRNLKSTIPELPAARVQRFAAEYNLPVPAIAQLVGDAALAEYYEKVASELLAWVSSSGEKVTPSLRNKLLKSAANWLLVELTKHLNKSGLAIDQIKITPENFAEFIKMVHRGELNSSAAQLVLARMFLEGTDPSEVVRQEDLSQMSDESALADAVDQVVIANPQPVGDVRAGKTKALQALVGLVMKQTKGKANPQIAQGLLKKRIGVA